MRLLVMRVGVAVMSFTTAAQLYCRAILLAARGVAPTSIGASGATVIVYG